MIIPYSLRSVVVMESVDVIRRLPKCTSLSRIKYPLAGNSIRLYKIVKLFAANRKKHISHLSLDKQLM